MHQNTIIFILIYIISQNDVIGAENEFEHQPNFLCNLTMDKIAEELMLRSFNLNCDALRGFFDTESFPEIEKILDGTDDSYEIDENQEEYHYRMKRCSEIVRQRRLLNEYEKRKQKEITGSQKPRKLRVKTLKTTSAPGTTIIQLEEDITERSLNYDEPILDVLEDQGYETEPLRGDIAQSESYQRSNNFPQNEKPSRSKSHIREKHKKMLEDSKNQKTLSREADKDPDDVTIVSSQNDNSFSQPSSYKTTTSISHTDSPQLLPTNQKKTSKEIKQASNDIKPKRKGLVSSLLDQIRDVMKGGKLEQMKDPPSKGSDEKSANDGLPDENFYEYELVTPGNFGKTIADQLPNDQSTPQGTNTHHAHDLLSTDSKKELQSKIEELMQLRKELLEVLKSKDKAKKMSYWKKINESETTSEVSEINKNSFRNSNPIYNDKITVKDEITASKSKSSTNEASAEKNIILEFPSSTSGSLISSMSSKSFPKLKFFTSGEELLPQKDTKKSFTKKLPSSADSTLEGGNEAQFLTGPPFSTSSVMESTSGHHYRTSLPSEIRPLMSGTIPSTAASLAGKSNKTFQQSSPSINHAENAQTQQITHIPMISSLLAKIPSSKHGKDPHHEDSSNSLIKEEDFEDMVGNSRQSMSEKLKNISHHDHGLKTFTSSLVIEKYSTPQDVSQFQTTSVEPTLRQKFHEVTIHHQLLPKSQEIFTNPSVAPFKQLSKEIRTHQRNNLDDDVTLQPAHHLHHHLTHPHLDKTSASLSLPIGTIPQKSNLGDNAVPRSAREHPGHSNLDRISSTPPSITSKTYPKGTTSAEKPHQESHQSSRPPLIISHYTSPVPNPIPSSHPPHLYGSVYPKKTTLPEKSHQESHSNYQAPPLQHHPQPQLDKTSTVQPSFSPQTTHSRGSTPTEKIQNDYPSSRPPVISHSTSPVLDPNPSRPPLISHNTSSDLHPVPSQPPLIGHHTSSSLHPIPSQPPLIIHHTSPSPHLIPSRPPLITYNTSSDLHPVPSQPPLNSHHTPPGLDSIPSQTPLISHHTSPGLHPIPSKDTSHFDTTYPKKSTPPEKSHHESHSSYHSPPLQHHPQSELDKIASVQPSFSSETTQPTGSTTAKKFQEGHPRFRTALISNNASPDLHPIPSLHPSHSLNTIQLKKTTPGISHQENYPTSQPPSISHHTSPGLDAILSTQPSHVLDTTHPKKSTLSEISHQESHTTQHSLPSDHQTSPLLNKIASRQHSFSSETIYPRGSLLAEKSYQENYPISSQQLHHPLLGLHKILTHKSNDGLGTFSKKIMISQKPFLEGSTHYYTTPHSAKTFAPQSTRSTSRIETKNRPIENDATNVLEKIKKLQKEKIEEIERLYQKHLEELRSRSQAHFTHTTPALSDSSLQHTTIKQHSSGGFSSHPTHMAITTTKPNPEFRSHLENKLENKASRLLDITKPYDTFYSTSKFLDLEPPPDEIVEKIPIPLPPMNPNDNWKYVTKLDKYYEKQALRSTTTTPRPIPTRPPLTPPSTKPPTTTTPRTRPTTPVRNTTRIPNQQPSSTTATPTRNQMAPVNYTINSTINRNYNITINLVTPDEPPRQSDDDSAEDPATDISSYSPNSSYQTVESDSAPSSPLFNNLGSAQNKEEPAGDFDSPPHPSVPRQSQIQSSNTSYFIPMNPTESSSNISQLATNHGNISQNTDSTDLREDQAEKSFTYSNPSGFQSQTPSRFNFPESSTMTAYQQMIDNLKSITLKVQAQPYFEDVNYSATQPLTSTTSQRPPEQSHLTQSLCAVGNCTQGCNNIFIVPNKTAEIIGILQLLDGMNSKNQPSSNESSMLQNSRSASTNGNILFQPGTFSDIKSMLGSIQTSHMSASENTKLRQTINDLLTALKQRRSIEYLKLYEHRQDLMVGESHQSIQIITQINEYVELLELMLVYLARDPDKLLDEGKDSRISNFESPYPPDDPQRRLIEDQFYYVHPKILNEFIDVYKKYSKGETYYGKPMWQYSQEHEPPKRPRTGVLGKSFGNLFNFQELVPALTYNRAPMYRPGVQYNDY